MTPTAAFWGLIIIPFSWWGNWRANHNHTTTQPHNRVTIGTRLLSPSPAQNPSWVKRLFSHRLFPTCAATSTEKKVLPNPDQESVLRNRGAQGELGSGWQRGSRSRFLGLKTLTVLTVHSQWWSWTGPLPPSCSPFHYPKFPKHLHNPEAEKKEARSTLVPPGFLPNVATGREQGLIFFRLEGLVSFICQLGGCFWMRLTFKGVNSG